MNQTCLQRMFLKLSLPNLCLIFLFSYGFMILSCSSSSIVSEPVENISLQEDWPKVSPKDAGFDPSSLKTLLDRVTNGQANIHSLIIERKGKLVAELYRRGEDRPINQFYGIGNPFAFNVEFNADKLHDVRSISKSVVSILFGLKKYEKQFPKPGVSVLSLYPELADLRTPERDLITVENLLAMNSGLSWAEFGRSFLTSDETRLLWKNEIPRFVLDRASDAPPGKKFNYSGGATAILADIISRNAQESFADIAGREIFEPLGILNWEWATDFSGRPMPFGGLRLRPRDMAKLGRLLLDQGKWKGRQIISEGWVKEILRSRIKTGYSFFSGESEELGYGYHFWVGWTGSKNGKVEWIAAIGNGGQRICIIPTFDMTIVITAGDYGSIEIQKIVGSIVDETIRAVSE